MLMDSNTKSQVEQHYVRAEAIVQGSYQIRLILKDQPIPSIWLGRENSLHPTNRSEEAALNLRRVLRAQWSRLECLEAISTDLSRAILEIAERCHGTNQVGRPPLSHFSSYLDFAAVVVRQELAEAPSAPVIDLLRPKCELMDRLLCGLRFPLGARESSIAHLDGSGQVWYPKDIDSLTNSETPDRVQTHDEEFQTLIAGLRQEHQAVLSHFASESASAEAATSTPANLINTADRFPQGCDAEPLLEQKGAACEKARRQKHAIEDKQTPDARGRASLYERIRADRRENESQSRRAKRLQGDKDLIELARSIGEPGISLALVRKAEQFGRDQRKRAQKDAARQK
jgi:hypothetical protein